MLSKINIRIFAFVKTDVYTDASCWGELQHLAGFYSSRTPYPTCNNRGRIIYLNGRMLNENAIKRIVLIEKRLGFIAYNNPHDVPDRAWKEAFEGHEFGDSWRTHDETCRYYLASKILGPLLGTKEFVISPTIYDPMTFVPFRKIVFERLCTIHVGSELIWDLGSDWADYSMLKELICIMWDTRVTQPVFVFDRTPPVDFTQFNVNLNLV